MSRGLEYFGSNDIFTLIVGKQCEKLYVARPILQQIPFFDNALKGNFYQEAKNKTFELPADQAIPVSDLLHFVFSNHVEGIKSASKGFGKEQEKAITKSYVRVFIVADKFMAEKTANLILDRLFEYHLDSDVDPDAIEILVSAGLQTTKLYKFLIKQLAGQMKIAMARKDIFRSSDNYFIPESEGFLAKWTSETMRAIMRELLDPESKMVGSGDKHDFCSLHTHQFTKTCKPTSTTSWHVQWE